VQREDQNGSERSTSGGGSLLVSKGGSVLPSAEVLERSEAKRDDPVSGVE